MTTLTPIDIYKDISTERHRQDLKWGANQHHADGTGSWMYQLEADAYKRRNDDNSAKGTINWGDILLEEVYEALAEKDKEKLITELIQVAAVVVAWRQDIASRESV